MRILFVSSEALPYFKSGGLADVARALPDALQRDGHEVRLFHPLYGFVTSHNLTLRRDLELRVPWPNATTVRCHLHQPETAAPAVLAEHAAFLDAAEPYAATVDPLTVGMRFALFARAALHYARQWGADVIHVNDWQSGLLPVYSHVDAIRIATVFSIHNLAYQGNFPAVILPRVGIPGAFFRTENGLEFFGQVSFIKGAIALADRVTTVSPTYAQEIQTPAHGAGLDGLLQFRARTLHGILNGIDVDAWNPTTDSAIAERYNSRSVESKDHNRTALLEELQLDDGGPLVVAVSRLAHQKGMDILFAALPRLLARGASIAVLGEGDIAMEQAFARAASANPRRIAAFFKFDDALARRLYAGGDFFVMPSRYEPCGLGQMIAQRYGTIPIVRRTGGLIDTVRDGVTGFMFDAPTADGLVDAAIRAFAFWRRKDWSALRRRCMRLDWSWSRSAQHYAEVYRAAIGPILG
ncbi:MAG TPA: glycogen/starch synthase [Longimicrobiales bacterium]|nr:glycogen/starch synthase [Longimicrobiales bacterium]